MNRTSMVMALLGLGCIVGMLSPATAAQGPPDGTRASEQAVDRGDRRVMEARPAPRHIARALGTGRGCDSPRVVNTHVEVCFNPYDDKFWVYDGDRDGRSAYAEWNCSICTALDQSGTCRNSLGNGHWGYCDYNMQEGRDVAYIGYTRDGGAWPNPRHDIAPPYGYPRYECIGYNADYEHSCTN